MSDVISNKKLLQRLIAQQDEIFKTQKEVAKNQLDFALRVSDFMNKQEGINFRVLGYLENDEKTDKKGVIHLSNENKERINRIETKDEVRVGKVVVISVIISAIFGIIGNLIIKHFLR